MLLSPLRLPALTVAVDSGIIMTCLPRQCTAKGIKRFRHPSCSNGNGNCRAPTTGQEANAFRRASTRRRRSPAESPPLSLPRRGHATAAARTARRPRRRSPRCPDGSEVELLYPGERREDGECQRLDFRTRRPRPSPLPRAEFVVLLESSQKILNHFALQPRSTRVFKSCRKRTQAAES